MGGPDRPGVIPCGGRLERPSSCTERTFEIPGEAQYDALVHENPGQQGRLCRAGQRRLEMSGRGDEIAAAQLRTRDEPFDLREVLVVGRRRGRLERGDRPGVVAQPCPQTADRAAQAGHVRVPER